MEQVVHEATGGIRLWTAMPMSIKSQEATIQLLMTRGRAFRKLKMLEKALTDMRGAAALIRILGHMWNRAPSINEVNGDIFNTLAMTKLGDDKIPIQRPHFTEKEREGWEKELGIGEYDEDKFFCANCGKAQTKTVQLKVCSKCKQKWFCSDICIRDAWINKGHKHECKFLRRGIQGTLTGEAMAQMREQIEENGFAVCTTNHRSYRIDMWDGEEGEFFNSFTDEIIKLVQIGKRDGTVDQETKG